MARSLRPGRSTVVLVVVALAVCILAARTAQAQKESVLYSFKNNADGIFPNSGVIADNAGNFYGTTSYGGTFGRGTIFKLSKQGKTILFSFDGRDGKAPSSLLLDSTGNFYGATGEGGLLACNIGSGCGTVFKLDATGKETVLHSFSASKVDGGYPTLSLVLDATGNLYGTTSLGGPSKSGTVFKLDAAGNETILYSFTGGNGGPDGAGPNGVIMDAAGNLYGTTSYGGTFISWGTVFKLDASGKETILHSFAYGADGGNPAAGLVMDASGNLYGTTTITEFGGAGTIFKIDPAGNYTILHTFSGLGDGGIPSSTLMMDAAGNLYGETAFGGTYGFGTVFKYDTLGNETILHSFGDSADGKYPQSGLSMNAAGHIFGTTQQGGKYGWGTVFTIIP